MTDKKHHRGHGHAHGANGQANGQSNGHASGQANGDAGSPAETEPANGGTMGSGGHADMEQAPQQAAGADSGLRAELDAARDRHLRLAAEFDNYRKRMQREMEEARPRAQAELAGKLLDALDDLQRIADYDPETTSARALHEGAEMVERKLLRALEAAGLERIDSEGKAFDPTVHEAITTVATEQADEDDTVADVFQQGYRFKGILLRPARVRVRKHG
jgi:molecular chaperone GrpE